MKEGDLEEGALLGLWRRGSKRAALASQAALRIRNHHAAQVLGFGLLHHGRAGVRHSNVLGAVVIRVEAAVAAGLDVKPTAVFSVITAEWHIARVRRLVHRRHVVFAAVAVAHALAEWQAKTEVTKQRGWVAAVETALLHW